MRYNLHRIRPYCFNTAWNVGNLNILIPKQTKNYLQMASITSGDVSFLKYVLDMYLMSLCQLSRLAWTCVRFCVAQCLPYNKCRIVLARQIFGVGIMGVNPPQITPCRDFGYDRKIHSATYAMLKITLDKDGDLA